MMELDLTMLRSAKLALDIGSISAEDFQQAKCAFIRAQQLRAGVDGKLLPEDLYEHTRESMVQSLSNRWRIKAVYSAEQPSEPPAPAASAPAALDASLTGPLATDHSPQACAEQLTTLSASSLNQQEQPLPQNPRDSCRVDHGEELAPKELAGPGKVRREPLTSAGHVGSGYTTFYCTCAVADAGTHGPATTIDGENVGATMH